MKLLNKLALFLCVAALAAAPVVYVTAQAADKPAQAEKPKKKIIDINSASLQELQTLKGVDADMARKIMQNRPYTSITQLVSKNVMEKKAYDEIKKDIEAKKPSEEQSKKKNTNKNTNKNRGGGKRR